MTIKVNLIKLYLIVVGNEDIIDKKEKKVYIGHTVEIGVRYCRNIRQAQANA